MGDGRVDCRSIATAEPVRKQIQMRDAMNIPSRDMIADQRCSRLLHPMLHFAVLTLLASLISPVSADDFLSGRDFHARLRSTVDFQWRDNPIRDAFERLESSQQLAVFLDRRTPTDRELTFRAGQQPLWTSLEQITRVEGLEWTVVDSVIVVGPPEPIERLGSVIAVQRQQIKKLPTARQRLLLARKPLSWPRLAQPRELVRTLFSEAGVEAANLQAVPHDLWPEGELPPLTWIDRVTLILNSVDLIPRFAADGRQVELVAAPTTGRFAREHSAPPSARVDFTALRNRFPELSITRVRNDFRVTAEFAEHAAVEKWLLCESTLPTRRSPGTRPAGGSNAATGPRKVHDVRVDQQPVGGVLQAVVKKLGWRLKVSPAAAARMNQRISINVKGVDNEGLLKATVDPAGLQYRINGDVVEIRTRDEP